MAEALKQGLARKNLITATRQAPSPSKDILHLEVTSSIVKLTTIPINPRCLKHALPPRSQEFTHEEFLADTHDILLRLESLFPNEFDRVVNIAKGYSDALSILPTETLVNIIGQLSLEDVEALQNVSQPLKDLCNSNQVWQLLYENHLGTSHLSEEMKTIAGDMGWKNFYFSRKINARRATKNFTRRNSLTKANAAAAATTAAQK